MVIILGIAAIGFGSTHAYAQNDNKTTQLNRNELRELRQSGDRDDFRQRAENLGINKMARPQLTDDQIEIIESLKESKDHEAIRVQLNEWGIEKPENEKKELPIDGPFQNLTEEQKSELQELWELDVEKEVINEKLAEFGIEPPETLEHLQLTDEQKEKLTELKETGDKDTIKEYFEEIGLKKPRNHMQKRADISDSLSDDEKEVLQEARNIARAGDKETAREMAKEVLEDVPTSNNASQGFFGFFKNLFK